MTGIAVLDLETTGLSYQADRIVEVGIVHLDGELRETLRWTTLVNPEQEVTASEIHGISAFDVRDAPTLADIAEDLMSLLQGRVIVAHNAAFDVNHLMLGLRRIGVDLPCELPAVVDTMRLSWALLGVRGLGPACERLSIDLDNAHAALADTLAASELLRRLLELDGAGIDSTGLDAAWLRYAMSPETGCWRSQPRCLPVGWDPLPSLLDAGAGLYWPGWCGHRLPARRSATLSPPTLRIKSRSPQTTS